MRETLSRNRFNCGSYWEINLGITNYSHYAFAWNFAFQVLNLFNVVIKINRARTVESIKPVVVISLYSNVLLKSVMTVTAGCNLHK